MVSKSPSKLSKSSKREIYLSKTWHLSCFISGMYVFKEKKTIEDIMKKVIHFLILGLAILHFTDAKAGINLKELVNKDMSLNEFVDLAHKRLSKEKMDIEMKVNLIKTFNDKNGDLEIDSYEILTMN
jgi:hypothetical protein